MFKIVCSSVSNQLALLSVKKEKLTQVTISALFSPLQQKHFFSLYVPLSTILY
jgi:hypothetical protein